jgi:PAS domain S-box-containing protein
MRFPKFVYPAAILIIAAVYFAAAKLGFSMADPSLAEQVTIVWPPTGIALVVMLLFGYRFWPGVALGAFLANVTTNVPILTACGIALGNTLEGVIGAWLLRRVIPFDTTLERLKDVVALVVLAAGISTTVSATIGATCLCLGGVKPWEFFGRIWLTWWFGDAMGDLVMAPVLLLWLRRPGYSAARIIEGAVLGASLILMCQIVFAGEFTTGIKNYPLEYTVFPFVIWAALRFGQQGTSAVTFVASVIAITGTMVGFGPFAKGSGRSGWECLFLLQIFMGVVAVTGLVLAGVTSERRLVERRRSADYAITQILAESTTLHQVAPRILQTICEMLDWDLGAVWMVDADKNNLRCVDLWHKPLMTMHEFVEATRQIRYCPGKGMPGRVWSLGRPVWIVNVVEDPNFPRAAIAERVGLHGAFAFPLFLGGKTAGAVEFFSRQIRSPDPDLLRMFATISHQLGQFIDRRQAEETRRASEERLRLALNAGRMGVWDWNIHTGEIKWSDDWEPIHGLAHSSFAGTFAAYQELIHPDDRDMVNQALARALQDGQGYDIEFRNLWPDGSVHWMAGKGQVVRDESGQPVRMIGIGMDITGRKTLEKELERRVHELAEGDRRKDEFLAMLAHELRNPLAPIRNALQILKTPSAGESLARMAQEVMDRQTQQLARLVDDLLDISRITRGKINLHREPIELAAVVKRAVETARPLIEEQRHEFTVSLPPQPIFIQGDLVRLAQALANVLNNAGKYTEKGGQVQLLAECIDDTAVIRVRDTGIGIPLGKQKLIFQAVVQGDSSTSRTYSETGLGLAISATPVDMLRVYC